MDTFDRRLAAQRKKLMTKPACCTTPDSGHDVGCPDSSPVTASHGQVTITCPTCGRRVPLWITNTDIDVDDLRGGLDVRVRASGPHRCMRPTS